MSEIKEVPDEMFLVAARALAHQVTDERLAAGALYPPVESLNEISREVGLAVARQARGIDVQHHRLAVGDELAQVHERRMR